MTNLTEATQYVVQFVGFRTTWDDHDFIIRWTPFAANFKKQGIRSIDLYHVSDGEDLAYISRNIWDEKIYLQQFPSGMAGSGGGGGITITQLGCYRIPSDQLTPPNEMQLIFSPDIVNEAEIPVIACLRLTDNVPFNHVLMRHAADKPVWLPHSLAFTCQHLKTM